MNPLKRIFFLLSVFSGFTAFSVAQDSIVVILKELAHNFNGTTFENTIHTPLTLKGTGFNSLVRYFTTFHRRPEEKLTFKPDTFPGSSNNNELKIMWLGHATVLIEIDGKRFLTDPIFSKRTSPYTKGNITKFLWPSRFFASPLKIENLPKLNGVIISHDHSDHLDYKSVVKLATTGVTFFVPLKVGDLLESWGIDKKQIIQIDWWDSISISKTHALVATPARHDSGRSPLFGTRDQTLWCSWVIAGPNHKVFFGGDTGYSPDFKEIGSKYGPFDVTLLPIGAYDRNWPYIHVTPEEAVAIHRDVDGNVMFPMHWGTFNLAIQAWSEPAKRVLNEAEKQHINVCLPLPGELITWPYALTISGWWEIDD